MMDIEEWVDRVNNGGLGNYKAYRRSGRSAEEDIPSSLWSRDMASDTL